ncbi:uncharacterized protein MELLADRAFT_103235 [Melampsora larici-populina 98AG31]|uniref:Uncharacterized protein n=1 Tax=Melampsora larici-populina (strain 98AG31 / pathotype 3-4-7) TaxID=747676 RepID=F4RAZ7_MELLP|nr:uncharacterized protein MELLADRAFT_103235 [Melampsora larici-populina 98AG31]EGG10690.1 hypothetical protein MELLADRAFT_103235 [Melampsora larici-populina 98AG31]
MSPSPLVEYEVSMINSTGFQARGAKLLSKEMDTSNVNPKDYQGDQLIEMQAQINYLYMTGKITNGAKLLAKAMDWKSASTMGSNKYRHKTPRQESLRQAVSQRELSQQIS